MIICAWCGVECDGTIYFVRNTEVLFSTHPGDSSWPHYTTWSRNTETKRFCNDQHRKNWFLEP
jgi:hypothetical protein